FTLDAAGNWSYTAADSQTAIQQLGAGQSLTDSFTAVSSDGTASQLVTVTIHRSEERRVGKECTTRGVTEDESEIDCDLTTGGALTIVDDDQDSMRFAHEPGIHSCDRQVSFTLDAAGNWSYTAADSQTAIQQLGAGQSLTDSFTAVSSDGTASQLVTVTIHGTNDTPVLGGVATGTVTQHIAMLAANPTAVVAL